MSFKNFKHKNIANTTLILGDYEVPQNSTAIVKDFNVCSVSDESLNNFDLFLTYDDTKIILVRKGEPAHFLKNYISNLVLSENESLEFSSDFGPFDICLSIEEQTN